MSNRVTVTDLNRIIDRINRETGQPMEPYSKDSDGKHRANIGNFHLSRAYGGFSLVQMVNDGGGCRDVLYIGHVSARELKSLMFAYIQGLSDCEQKHKHGTGE